MARCELGRDTDRQTASDYDGLTSSAADLTLFRAPLALVRQGDDPK